MALRLVSSLGIQHAQVEIKQLDLTMALQMVQEMVPQLELAIAFLEDR